MADGLQPFSETCLRLKAAARVSLCMAPLANSLQLAGRAFPAPRDPHAYAASTTGMHLVAFVLIVFFGGALNSYFVAGWYFGLGPALSVEHGHMEHAQLVLLAIALVLFLFAYSKGTGAVRVAAGALSMLLAAGLAREIDVKSLGGPDWFRWLSRHGLQEILFVLMTLPIPLYLLVQRRHVRELMRLALRGEAIFLYVAGAAILAGSYILDRKVTHTDHVRFLEEFIEYNGYLLFAAAAWFHARLIGDPRFSPKRP